MKCDGDMVMEPIVGRDFAISQSQEPTVSVKGGKVNGAKCDFAILQSQRTSDKC